eukprot:6210118-Pleurochrysis_carterae.AAC.2
MSARAPRLAAMSCRLLRASKGDFCWRFEGKQARGNVLQPCAHACTLLSDQSKYEWNVCVSQYLWMRCIAKHGHRHFSEGLGGILGEVEGLWPLPVRCGSASVYTSRCQHCNYGLPCL